MNENIFYNLKLLRTKNIGPASYNLFLKTYGDAKNALEFINANLAQYTKYTIPTDEDIHKEIEQVKSYGANFLDCFDMKAPDRLRYYGHVFPIITYMGNINLLMKPMISIVGTRQPSILGQKFTKQLVGKICKNFVTLSGLAIGVDTIVHENSIDSGTVAILPGGINVVYPSQNKMLYEAISKSGCLISLHSFDTQPKANLFAIRNRMIAYISDALVITEATEDSGSLITGNFALKEKKRVFAVPGHPLDHNYTGNNFLIRNGASIIDLNTDLSVIKEEYKISDRMYTCFDYNYKLEIENINIDHMNMILDLISFHPIHIEDLLETLQVQQPQMTVSKVLSACVCLEMQELISINHGFYVQRI